MKKPFEGMPPIYTVKNQYRGINAHFNSFLQAEGNGKEWEAFHNDHISDLRTELNRQLEAAGFINYYARPTRGLQIRRIEGNPQFPESDAMELGTSQKHKSPVSSGYLLQAGSGVQLLTVEAALSDPEKYTLNYFWSVGLYRVVEQGKDAPVAWIELLSPSNKPGGTHYPAYRQKREALLETEAFSFVEIDYLHKSRSTIASIPDYTRYESESAPYRIAVLDPRLGFKEGPAYILSFHVDVSIPIIPIPLSNEDVFHFNLGIAHNLTYERIRYGLNKDTRYSYTDLPPEFQTYSERDQHAILAKMLALVEAVRDGVDLETLSEPLPGADQTAVLKMVEELQNK